MIEQQLRVSHQQLAKQAYVDWNKIKRLFHQTAKQEIIPEPDQGQRKIVEGKRFSQADVERVVTQVMREVLDDHKKQLIQIEQKMEIQMERIKERVSKLQEFLLQALDSKLQSNNQQIPQQKKQQYYSPPQQKGNKSTPKIPSTAAAKGSEKQEIKSFIHIEDDSDHEVSLLDDEPMFNGPPKQIKEVNIMERNMTAQSMLQGLATTSNRESTRINRDNSEFNFNFSSDNQSQERQMNKIFTVNCVFHDQMLKELKEELNLMKKQMEQKHGVRIQDSQFKYLLRQQERKVRFDKNPAGLMTNLSSNAQKHLLNENKMLRAIKDQQEDEIARIQKQLRIIKKLMIRSLQLSRRQDSL